MVIVYLMKTNNHKNHHKSVHQRIEYLFRHRTFLVLVLSFMALGLIKYEMQLLGILHEMYGHGLGLMSTYTHQEITRMPVQYGNEIRHTATSGE